MTTGKNIVLFGTFATIGFVLGYASRKNFFEVFSKTPLLEPSDDVPTLENPIPSEDILDENQRKLADMVVGEGNRFAQNETYAATSLPKIEELKDKFPIVTRVKQGHLIFGAYPEGKLIKFDRPSWDDKQLVCIGCEVGGVVGEYYLYYPDAQKKLEWLQPMT